MWHKDKKHGEGVFIKAHGRRIPHFHDRGKADDSLPKNTLQSLTVLCIEKIGESEELVSQIDECLTPELASSIRTYRRNELNIVPIETPVSFINHVQAMFNRFTGKTLSFNSNRVTTS